MYGSTLTVTLPETEEEGGDGADDFTRPVGKDVADLVSVRGSGVVFGVAYTLDGDEDGNVVTINIDEMDVDDTVTVTFKDIKVKPTGVDATVDLGSEFGVTTSVQVGDIENNNEAVTKLTGGAIYLIPGSGTLAVTSPSSASVKVNATVSRLILTYTAAAKIDDDTLVIAVPIGIEASKTVSGSGTEADPYKYTLGTDSGEAGYVSSPDSDEAVPDVEVEDITPGDVAAWTVDPRTMLLP